MGLVVIVVLAIVVRHAEPLLRARVVETLSARFRSRVELDQLKVSVYRGLLISAKGLRVYGQTDPNIHDEGMQPLIAVDEFHFRTGVLSMLRTPMHVGTVYIKGLDLNIPPKGDRQQLTRLAPKGEKTIKINVGEFRLEKAHLVINTNRRDKLPLDFDIQDLSMRDIGPDQPLSFRATLVNPKPIGNIASHGEFGPFDSEDPRETRVAGEYTFSNADLGTLKGIGGILSSTGRYQGTIGRMVVDGQTDTPDFQLNLSGRPVPLKTVFHAVVDGTSGDTYLQPVNATILSTPLTAFGFVVKSADPQGHHIQLDATISSGKIENLLKLAVQTDPPVMTGTVRLEARIDLPAGTRDLSDRLQLKGKFEVAGGHFSNDRIQSKVDALSRRSQGKPQLASDDVPENVKSRFGGNFVLKDSVLSFPNLVFQMPGTRVDLAGTYSLDGKQFDFHGHARFEARLSQMVGGWKSMFLRPVNPFLSKNGAGTEVPIKITGTKSEPHFGLDLFNGKKKKAEKDTSGGGK
ncbi:MAG TPA: AsmA-like C-terminal region-containing protein [Terriglobales bacterium]|nr:AsmA-like C-terminal region-containing protein [Terriglobales bacterium]